MESQERHGEGAYYLEWREGGKRVRLSVGKDAQAAVARCRRKEAELNALNCGVAVRPDAQNLRRLFCCWFGLLIIVDRSTVLYASPTNEMTIRNATAHYLMESRVW
ncbi:MAG: hypothetical protein DMG76_04325 [Acidobacteria bacterium]|nr:MAG: hypothetical protein DMG76_04325 [Acidobacteriota bacterium]